MRAAAEELQFERAARLRDRIAAVRKAAEPQQMVSDRAEDFDVVGLAEDPLEASVQIFHVRRGRVVGAPRLRGREGRGPDRGPSSWRVVVAQVYGADGAGVPAAGAGPRGAGRPRAAAEWLRPCARRPGRQSRCRSAGPSAPCRRPSTRSAGEDLARHRLRRARRPQRPARRP